MSVAKTYQASIVVGTAGVRIPLLAFFTYNNNNNSKGRYRMKEKRATMITHHNRPSIKIEFPFDIDTIGQVKTLNGRKYHPDERYWTCPLCIDFLEQLSRWDFILCDQLKSFLGNIKKADDRKCLSIKIPGLKGKLLPFQKYGVSKIEQRKGRVLLADEQGLGKTIQALAWLQLHPELRPAVIVVPATMKFFWHNKIIEWLSSKEKITILSGKKPREIKKSSIIICNWDILWEWSDKIKKTKCQVLIADEVQYSKNSKAKRTKALKKVGKGVKHIIALSGTPATSRPIELYNAIKLVDDTVIPDLWTYGKKYCGAHHNGFGWDFSGATNTQELHHKLINTIMIRRLKKDVLPDLPDKLYSFIPMEIDNSEDYKKAKDNFLRWVEENKGIDAANRASNAEAFSQMESLKQVAVKGKMTQAIQWVKDTIDTGNKLVIFATHKFVIDQLMSAFPNISVKIDGATAQSARGNVVDRFQMDDKIRLFIGNIKAAGVGITLTAASNVAFLEFPWTPGELAQAEDRCHRIGQKNCVTIHYLLALKTIEEEIAYLLDSKRNVLGQVLDGKEIESTSLIAELIKHVKEK